MGHSMEKRQRRFRYMAPALALPLLLLAACGSSSNKTTGTPTGGASSAATSGADIKVMVIAPFTLAVAPSKANYDAVRIQADNINAKGGINGHKVVVIGCDDQTDPNVAAKCAQQAVSEKVVAVLGQFSLVGPAIWPIINAAGIPEIGLIQYGAQEQIAPTAFPVTPAVVFAEGTATGYLAKEKGCKNVADAQADAGENTKVPIALNKAAVARYGAKYVGPFLLSPTGSLANVPALAKSITDKSDCGNISDGENGIQLMKAILQINPNYKFATTSQAVPSTWVTELGAQASSLTLVGTVAPDSADVPGVKEYLSEMKAKAGSDVLSDISKQAWASFYAFSQVAKTIKGDITAKSLTDALSQASAVTTEGISGTTDFTKATPLGGTSRTFNTQLFVIGAKDGVPTEIGTVDAKDYVS